MPRPALGPWLIRRRVRLAAWLAWLRSPCLKTMSPMEDTILFSSSPSSASGNRFQDLQRMLETTDSTQPNTYYVLSYPATPIIKYNLYQLGTVRD